MKKYVESNLNFKRDRFIASSIDKERFEIQLKSQRKIQKLKKLKNNYYQNLIDSNFQGKIQKNEKVKEKNFSFLQNEIYKSNLQTSDLDISENNQMIRLEMELLYYNHFLQDQDPVSLQINMDQISRIKFCDQKIGILGSDEWQKYLLFDIETQQVVQERESRLRFTTMDFNDNILILGNEEGKVYLQDIRTEKIIKQYYCHTGDISVINAQKLKHNFILSGSFEDEICLFDIRKGCLWNPDAHNSMISNLIWTDKENEFISSSCGDDNKICYWNTSSQQLLKFQNRNSKLYKMDFTIDGNLIVSQGSPDNSIEILDRQMKRLKILGKHQKPIYKMALNFQKTIAVTCSVGEMKYWNVQDLKKQIKDLVR